MAHYIDALLMVFISFALIQGYRDGYFKGFFRIAGTVLAWAVAYLYTPFLAKNVAVIMPQGLTGMIQKNIANNWQLTATSGEIYLESELPNSLMDCLRRHLALLRLDQTQILQAIQNTLNNFLVNLFCFVCILLSVKLILAGITSFFSNKQTLVVTKHSGWGLVLGLMDAGFSILLLSGILIPFLFLFDRLGLASIVMQSRILRVCSEFFYYLFADWFII